MTMTCDVIPTERIVTNAFYFVCIQAQKVPRASSRESTSKTWQTVVFNILKIKSAWKLLHRLSTWQWALTSPRTASTDLDSLSSSSMPLARNVNMPTSWLSTWACVDVIFKPLTRRKVKLLKNGSQLFPTLTSASWWLRLETSQLPAAYWHWRKLSSWRPRSQRASANWSRNAKMMIASLTSTTTT